MLHIRIASRHPCPRGDVLYLDDHYERRPCKSALPPDVEKSILVPHDPICPIVSLRVQAEEAPVSVAFRPQSLHWAAGERNSETDCLAPHPVRIESVSGEFIPPIYKGCQRYLRLRSSHPELLGDLAASDCKCMIGCEIQRRGTPRMR
jgi:hypothetical protein